MTFLVDFLAPVLKPSLSSSHSHSMIPPAFNSLQPLCQLPAGTTGRVRELTGNADFCQRVREMGFGESAVVKKVGGSGPFICQVNGTRIALSHAAAMCILIEQVGSKLGSSPR